MQAQPRRLGARCSIRFLSPEDNCADLEVGWRVRDKKQEDLPGSCDKGGRAVGGAVKGRESLTEAVAKNVGKAMVGKCHSGTI